MSSGHVYVSPVCVYGPVCVIYSMVRSYRIESRDLLSNEVLTKGWQSLKKVFKCYRTRAFEKIFKWLLNIDLFT